MGLRLAGSIRLAVHTVVRGRGWLCTDGPGSAVELVPGEVTLVRGDPDHHIGHERGAVCLEPAEFRALHTGGAVAQSERATVFRGGAYRFSGDIGSGLLEALPQVLALSAAVGDPLRDVIALLSRELAQPEPGRPTVLDRLLDVLLVLAIRGDLNAALQAAIHEDAGHPRSVPELAAISGLPRAAVARTSVTGSAGRPCSS